MTIVCVGSSFSYHGVSTCIDHTYEHRGLAEKRIYCPQTEVLDVETFNHACAVKDLLFLISQLYPYHSSLHVNTASSGLQSI